MAAKHTRLAHKIAIQLHLVVERRPVRKLLDTNGNCCFTRFMDV